MTAVSDPLPVYPVPHPATVAELADQAGEDVRILGDDRREVTSVAAMENAVEGSLCFCSYTDERARAAVAGLAPGAVLVIGGDAADKAVVSDCTLILHPRPRYWFIRAVRALFMKEGDNSEGAVVSPQAIVDPAARISPRVRIDPGAVIEADVEIGSGCVIRAGAVLCEGSHLGSNIVVQSSTVIGAIGLAMEKDESGVSLDLPHLGRVTIGDGVRVGANTTLVRGTLRDTVIGRGCTIGNQVNIGHNVTIGENCFVSSGVTVAGSVAIGGDSWIGPGATVLNKVRIAENATVATGSIVVRDVEPGAFVAGNPARPVPRREQGKAASGQSQKP